MPVHFETVLYCRKKRVLFGSSKVSALFLRLSHRFRCAPNGDFSDLVSSRAAPM
jgi:hypothetical protein